MRVGLTWSDDGNGHALLFTGGRSIWAERFLEQRRLWRRDAAQTQTEPQWRRPENHKRSDWLNLLLVTVERKLDGVFHDAAAVAGRQRRRGVR